MVDVENHHFGGATGLATGLDGAGGGIGTAHEADGPRSRAAALEQLVGRADLRQVDPGPRAALEDHSLLGVPVEDGVHLVLHRQDEAVVNAQICAQVFTALGLNVVDIHHTDLFDTFDLKTLGCLGSVTLKFKAPQELLLLRRIYEPDFICKCDPIAKCPDRETPATLPVGAGIILTPDPRV